MTIWSRQSEPGEPEYATREGQHKYTVAEHINDAQLLLARPRDENLTTVHDLATTHALIAIAISLHTIAKTMSGKTTENKP
jgi:hypothetical protein